MNRCRQCGQVLPSTARNHAFVLCADCIPPEFHPSRRRPQADRPTFTDTSFVPGPADYLHPTPPPNPTEKWQAELARAKDVHARDVDRLITRTPRKRSRWGRPWERRR